MTEKPDNQNICNAGEYYLASILSSKGFTTTLTLGRAEKYDIMAINPKKKTIKLQIKTLFGKGCQWRMSPKNEEIIENNLFYGFVRLNSLEKEPEFWIVPSRVVASQVKKSYNKWVNSLGRNGKKHKPGPWRAFRIKTDKYYPKKWTEKCKKYYKAISLLNKNKY